MTELSCVSFTFHPGTQLHAASPNATYYVCLWLRLYCAREKGLVYNKLESAERASSQLFGPLVISREKSLFSGKKRGGAGKVETFCSSNHPCFHVAVQVFFSGVNMLNMLQYGLHQRHVFMELGLDECTCFTKEN